ncbi:MAG TPA: hypothetical protein DER11_07390 [Janibacter terrae]|nr:hypothetical protein [Janibacter terrae]
MATTTATTAPTTIRWAERPPQDWAVLAAWGTLLASLPSALWRLLMIGGALPGTDELRRLHQGEVGYVLGLSITQVLCGVLVVGLVRPWGERCVGVAIHRSVPVALGALGGLAMTYLFTISMALGLLAGRRADEGTVHDGALVLMVVAYAPMLLFGPLTLVATAGYALRRRR